MAPGDKKDKPNQTERQSTIVRKKAMVKALESSLGIVSTALTEAGVGKTQFYQWLKDDAQFNRDVAAVADRTLDFVKSKLFERINGYKAPDILHIQSKGKIITKEVIKYYPPDVKAITYYLDRKGKEDGFGNTIEVTGKGGAPLIPITKIEIIRSNGGAKNAGDNGVGKPAKLDS